VERAISSLTSNGVELTRDQWLEDAIECDKAQSYLTCRAIVKAMIGHGLEDEERKDTWMEDAENCAAKVISPFYTAAVRVRSSILIMSSNISLSSIQCNSN